MEQGPKEMLMQVVKGPHSEKLLVNWLLRSTLQLANSVYEVRMSPFGPGEDGHVCVWKTQVDKKVCYIYPEFYFFTLFFLPS